MEINFLKDTKDEIIMEIVGVNHTFCAALKEALYSVKEVVAASYAIDHPLVGKPRFVVKTDGKTEPRDAIKKALKAMKAQDKKMDTAIDAAF